MFIKRAKSRPSLRAREHDAESAGSPLAKSSFTGEDAVDPEANDGSGSVLERKKAQKKEKRRDGLGKPTRLSFGGDDEPGETTPFKPKKSLLSQSLQSSGTPASSSSSPTASTSSSIYSREYLSALKAATPSRAPRRATVEDAEESDDDDDDDGSGLSRLARDKYASTLVEDTTAGIPDAAAVASAKIKRQAALENAKHGGNLGEDFISLGGGQISVYEGGDGPHPESRLMREEDEGDEGDEGEWE